MVKLTVVGAGLVGSLWAYLLRKQGFEVELYEKRSDPRQQNVNAGRSINLVITSRGIRGLEVAGLLDRVKPITVPVYGRMIHPNAGDMQFQPYGRDKNEYNHSVSRGDLNNTLIDVCEKAGVQIYFDHPVDEINLEKKCFKSRGKTIAYNTLFATDGAGSVIRHAMGPSETEWLPSDYKELYLPAKPNGEPALDLKGLHIWPRGTHMMMALANRDNSFTVTLYLPKTGHRWAFDTIKSPERVRELFESEFPDAIPLMPNYQKDFMENPQGALGTVRCGNWIYKDSVALMGDAAHAIVPFFGQGMNCGFEDCTRLLEFFQQFKNWGEAFKKYNEVQRPNANAIADMALENFKEMSDKVGDAHFLFLKKVESLLESNFPELYRSRYGMITYTLIPYQVAQVAGVRQAELLKKLTQGIEKIEQVDLSRAKQLLETEFAPWLKAQGYSTKAYGPREAQ